MVYHSTVYPENRCTSASKRLVQLAVSWSAVLCLVTSFCAVVLFLSAVTSASAEDNKALLGKYLFFDDKLSKPNGQSCASCHDPSAGFSDPRSDLPVSLGAITQRCGNRNSPSAAYAAYSPPLHYESCGCGGGGCGMGGGRGRGGGGMGGGCMMAGYVGGQFWDGRAADLVEQAKGPFLNPLEMNNPNKAAVINAVRNSAYAGMFKQVYGKKSLNNVDTAYNYVAEAIAEYEKSDEVCQFSSKYDYYTSGMASLTSQELRGLSLFKGKGKCASCHSMQPGPYGKPLFTNFKYFNVGAPGNEDNPFYLLPRKFNPYGTDYVDLGLGGYLNDSMEYGKFKTPTLRNVAVTYPYMHNGVFRTLGEVVHFYNTRDVESWPSPEVDMNVFRQMGGGRMMMGSFGRLGLTSQEEKDIVAFLGTLTDGY